MESVEVGENILQIDKGHNHGADTDAAKGAAQVTPGAVTNGDLNERFNLHLIPPK